AARPAPNGQRNDRQHAGQRDGEQENLVEHMHPSCISSVSAAAGRILSPAEIRNIDDRMNSTMRRLARQDPAAWMAKPNDQRVLEAAQAAVAEIKAESARKVENAQRQILATVDTSSRIDALKQN